VTSAPRWRRGLAVLVLLVLLPLGLRLWSIDHGLPRDYVPDTHVVRNALGMAGSKNPVPRAGEYSSYPNLLPYMLLPLYAVYYVRGRVAGDWESVAEFGDALKTDASGAHLIARWLVALFGALTPWAVYRAARAAGLSSGAWVAGLATATSLLHVQFSTQQRPWVPTTFFLVLAAWAAILYVREPRRRYLAASGIAAGLAFATHQGGLLGLGLAGLAWLLAPLSFARDGLRERLIGGTASVALFALVALLLGHPHYLWHGATETKDVIGGDAADVSIGGMSAVLELSGATFVRLGRALVGYEPALLLLGLAGLWPALARRATRPVIVWTLAWAAFFMTNVSDHVRYLLPVAVFLSLAAGCAAEPLLRRRWGMPALALLLALASVQALRLVALLDRTDTRADAEALVHALPPGSRLGVDRYGPAVDLSLESLELLAELRRAQQEGLTLRERYRESLLREGELPSEQQGVDAVFLADLFEFDERAGTVTVRAGLRERGADPRALLAALGVTHLLLVDRRPGAGPRNLLGSLVEGRDPIHVVDPARGGGTREAFLPTEMDFPLTGLWSVSRPGPYLALYEL